MKSRHESLDPPFVGQGLDAPDGWQDGMDELEKKFGNLDF